MSDLIEVRQQLHAAGNALQVIEVFLRECDPQLLDADMRRLYEAALRSIDKTKVAFEKSSTIIARMTAE